MEKPIKPKWFEFWKRKKYKQDLINYTKQNISKAFESPEVIEAVKQLSDSIDLIKEVYKLNTDIIKIEDLDDVDK